MAELENPNFPEEAKSLQCDYRVKNHPEVFVPIVAECIDGALAGLDCVNPGELGLKNGAYPPENLFDSCPGKKVWGKSEAKRGVLDLKAGCPKETLDSSVLPDPKVVVSTDLLGKGDPGLDLETGKEINGGDASFWGSANRLFGKALKGFIQGDFGQSFDGSIARTKTVEPTFSVSGKVDIYKPAVDLHKSEAAIQKSEPNSGTNVRNKDLAGSGKLRQENGHHIKPSSKKPPRPPRPPRAPKVTTDPSKEKLMKDILRRAKLERITSLKKKQIATSKPSNSRVWALTFTLCFCVVLLMQGIFSPGNGRVQMSPEAAVQASAFSVHKFVSHATNGQHLNSIKQDQTGNPMDKAPDQSNQTQKS